MECRGYRFLEHTADAYVEASGRSLEEAFENAAKAMFDIMTDISRIERKVRKEIVDEGIDLENLLYRWLEDLLIIHDSEGLVFSDFSVNIEEGNEGYKIKGYAFGERFDPSKHPVEMEVKAVTYSLMEVKQVGECWVVRVVFDL